MNTYAQVVDGIVVNVVVADPDWISQQPGEWHLYDDERPAAIGWTWDDENKRAIPPQPFPSWTLDDNYRWQPPVPYPSDGNRYTWDEDNGTWVPVEP